MKSVQSPLTSERVYSLDALRAIMMLLGIVLHGALTYGNGNYGEAWPLKNSDNSVWFHLVAGLIHAFRMPTFFVASGYFGALLFDRKGAKAMLKNRFRRLLLPFVVAVLISYPIILFSYSFSTYTFTGATSPFMRALTSISPDALVPQSLFHLWFLYYLILFVVIAWLIAIIFRKDSYLATALTDFSRHVLAHFIPRTAIISLLFFGGLCWMGSAGLKTSMSWSIKPDILVTYFMFFGTGWMIYQTKTLVKLAIYPIAQLSVAFCLFMLFVCIPWPTASWTLLVQAGIAAVCGTLFIFGFIGLFQHYFNHYSPKLNYLMEASYWVYIVHLPIVLFIPGLFANFSLPILLKFSITVGITTSLSLLSYHYLVRTTLIGKFLYGKIYISRGSKQVLT